MLKTRVRLAFGLAFDVEKTSETASNFRPAQFDYGAGKELFGAERVEGFASLLRLNFADELIIVGGNESREPAVNRAIAIRKILLYDHGIASDKVRAIPSTSNTGGNIAAIEKQMVEEGLRPRDVAVVSNHYHLPRAALDLAAAGLAGIRLYSAEAFVLIERPSEEGRLLDTFGDNPFAERVVEEVKGVADKLRGTYKPRTDVQPVRFRAPEFR